MHHHAEPDGETWLKQFAYYAAGAAGPLAGIWLGCRAAG